MDKDGSYTYSRVVTVNPKLTGTFGVYPNPSTNAITVSYPVVSEKASLQLLSSEGKKIIQYSITANTTQTAIDVSKLLSGNYLLVLDNNGTLSTIKFIKQ
jgi:hypothetical protein